MVGCNSGRATPFLRRHRPSAIPNHQPRRNATYHSREAVQTTEASSVGSDGGDDRVAGEGREVGQQALETVDGGAIGGSSGGLLGDGAWRALRLGDRTVAQRRGGVLVVVVIEHRG